MKKLIVIVCIALLYTNVYAATKCVPDGKGGVCCWDTKEDGPWRPISC
jgi:hypothetical protein